MQIVHLTSLEIESFLENFFPPSTLRRSDSKLIVSSFNNSIMEREPTIDKDNEDENKSPTSVNASTIVKIGEYYLSTLDMFPTAEPQEPFEIHKTGAAFGGCISSSYLLDTSRGKFFIKEGYPLQMSLTIIV